jgi:small subunit ribosomal protein S16
MSVKIRLARRGRRKNPFYHIVVADARAPRDGRFIEQIGSYNPMTSPATIELDIDRAYDWLSSGAQPTYTAKAILRFKGVLYKKHLQRGVAKGALTQEQADQKLKEWIAEKDIKITSRVEQVRKEMEDFRKMVAGEVKSVQKQTAEDDTKEAFREKTETPPIAEVQEEVVDEVVEVAAEKAEVVAETVKETVEEVKEVVADVAEEVAEPAAEKAKETPAKEEE